MTYWALAFLAMALTAAALRLCGLAGLSEFDAWALFLIGLLLALISLLLNSQDSPPQREREDQARPERNPPAPRQRT